jgi:hypothetical protein
MLTRGVSHSVNFLGEEKRRVGFPTHAYSGTAGFSREGTGESVLLKCATFLQKLAEQDGASSAALWEGSRLFLSRKTSQTYRDTEPALA